MMMQQLALSLTDVQMRWLRQASKAVPITRCDEFLRAVAAHLNGTPSDAAVSAQSMPRSTGFRLRCSAC